MKALSAFSFGIPNSVFPTGNSTMKEELGGKGANLAEMSSCGIPVPPGFTLPCELSVQKITPEFEEAVKALVSHGYAELTTLFGHAPLVSVRSGARVSMPGMMDTILNVGLCFDTLPYWEGVLGERAALDSYRRLIQMYSSVVLGVPLSVFESLLNKAKEEAGVEFDYQLNENQLTQLVSAFLEASPDFPQNPMDQLYGAVFAVFRSWNTDRAKEYRKIYSIPDTWGTAANIQAMVFGNSGENSCTGVVFTRCPSTGEEKITGEFLVNAQGEDVVAGIRTPEPMTKFSDWNPELAEELGETLDGLEFHYRDMQDVEFTVQNGKLYILQTRSGKRTPKAAFNIAADLYRNGLLSLDEVKTRVSNTLARSLLVDAIDTSFVTPPYSTGIAAGGSVVEGVAVFDVASAINCKEPCILVRNETDPDDIAGMNVAVGVLTATGGLTSHAAVVARGMGKTCVVGCTDMVIQDLGKSKTAYFKGSNTTLVEGQMLTIDGSTGNIWVGTNVPVVKGAIPESMLYLAGLVSKVPRFPLVDTTANGIISLFVDMATNGLSVVEVDLAVFNENTVANLLLGVSTCPELTVILNTKPPFAEGPVTDVLLRHFGDFNPVKNWQDSIANQLNQWTPSLKKRFILRGSLPGVEGFNVVGAWKTVSDMMGSFSGSFGSERLMEVFGSKEACEVVCEALKSKGFLTSPPPEDGTYWFEAF